MKKRLTFGGLVLGITSAVILYLMVGPLVMNALAGKTWRQTPCHIAPSETGAMFYYEVEGAHYVSTRRDFWQSDYVSEKRNWVSGLPDNDTCWVNPHRPAGAVFRLDAFSNWSDAGGRLAASAMLIVAGGALAWLAPRAVKKRQPT